MNNTRASRLFLTRVQNSKAMVPYNDAAGPLLLLRQTYKSRNKYNAVLSRKYNCVKSRHLPIYNCDFSQGCKRRTRDLSIPCYSVAGLVIDILYNSVIR